MAVYDFFLSRNSAAVTVDNYVGHIGRLFYDDVTGNIRISNGVTPGGAAIPISIATASQAGAILPGQGLEVIDVFGTTQLQLGEGLGFDSTSAVAMLPASSNTLGGIKIGPGVVLNSESQLIIDSQGLDFSFGDFVATTQPGIDSAAAAYLSSINPDQDIVIQSNGAGSVSVIGPLSVFPVNGSIAEREPVFSVDSAGAVFSPTLNITNKGELGFTAPMTVTTNTTGLTQSPDIVNGTIAQFTGRDDIASLVVHDNYGVDVDRGTGGSYRFRSARGTSAAPAAAQANDVLGSINAAGWGTTGYSIGAVAEISLVANQDYTDTARGGRIDFSVNPINSTNNLIKTVSIDATGIVLNSVDSGVTNATFVAFDTTHIDNYTNEGILAWSASDGTLNLHHAAGVTQQIGQELYAYVKNVTSTNIEPGTCVRFDGAENNGEARLLVAPFAADGTFPNLYGLGIATQLLANGQSGRVCVWGKVRNINTSGSVDNPWQVGDILYVRPTGLGDLTKVKPTAPDNVVPVAVVLKVDTTDGELFVRPTIEQSLQYGVFTRNTSYLLAAANTAYTVPVTDIEITNGVTIGTPASRLVIEQSGLYQIDWTMHWNSIAGPAADDIWYTWIRKNGVDIPNSMRSGNIVADVANLSASSSRILSLGTGDYVEIAVAASSTNVRLVNKASTLFGPSSAALEVNIVQIQQ